MRWVCSSAVAILGSSNMVSSLPMSATPARQSSSWSESSEATASGSSSANGVSLPAGGSSSGGTGVAVGSGNAVGVSVGRGGGSVAGNSVGLGVSVALGSVGCVGSGWAGTSVVASGCGVVVGSITAGGVGSEQATRSRSINKVAGRSAFAMPGVSPFVLVSSTAFYRMAFMSVVPMGCLARSTLLRSLRAFPLGSR